MKDTDFVFVVLLLYDKILSNPIKILKSWMEHSISPMHFR